MRRMTMAAVLSAVLVLAACSDSGGSAAGDPETASAATAEHDPDGVLRFAYILSPSAKGEFTWDPSASNASTSDLGLFHWVYGGLMRPTADGGMVPDLAEEASVVGDDTIEVSLRPGLVTSDGAPITAETVKVSLEANLARPGLPAFGSEFYDLSSVEVIGETTVRLTIPNGTAPGWFDRFMTGPETVIVPPGTDFADPTGAGPFVVTEFVPEQRVRLEKNPDYWDADAIELGAIELVNAPDFQRAVSALAAGQVDAARIDQQSLPSVPAGAELTTVPDPSGLVHSPICKSDAPLADARVRTALNVAIDRNVINEVVFDGNATPAADVWPTGNRFHNPDLDERWAHDPERARRLLEEAGYPDGIAIDFMPIPSGVLNDIAQIVQQQWSEAGIAATIVPTSNYVQDFSVDGKADVGMVPIMPGGRSKLAQWVGTATANICRWDDDQLNDLVQQLERVSDASDEAVELWHELQAKVVDDALSMPILFQPLIYASDPARVTGLNPVAIYAIGVPEVRDIRILR